MAAQDPPSLVGRLLGPYQILSVLGAGGMGEVYKAKDTRLNRTVAIKVLPPDKTSDPERKRRFVQEARGGLGGLNHPQHHHHSRHWGRDGIDFVVMEYLEGETLAGRLRKGALPLEQALGLHGDCSGARRGTQARCHSQGLETWQRHANQDQGLSCWTLD